MKAYKVWDAADGTGTPGRVFTASISQEVIPALGTRLDYLKVGLKGAVSTAAVAIETFAQLLQPFTLRKGAANRIILNGDELCALSSFIFGNRIAVGENTDNTGNDFLGNIMVPVFDTFEADRQFLLQADRVAQTNIATETISVTAYADGGFEDRKPVYAVRIPATTAGAAGMEQFGPKMPAIGTLKGLIFKVPNGFSDANIDVSLQRIKVYKGTQEVAAFNDLGDAETLGDVDFVTPTPYGDLMRQFRAFRFGANGIDTKDGDISIAWDVQDVSDAIVVIPVIEVDEQTA